VWSFVFLGMVVLTVLYCIIIYAFVTRRYFQMLKLSAIYNTEQGTRTLFKESCARDW
jgi:hypothetical protein